MSTKIQPTIADSVGDTLFIPLYMRYLESKRPDGIIHDAIACDLVERLDYDFSKYDKATKSQLGTALRIQRFDRAASEFVEKHENPVVVNIGAGLDARYQRVGTDKGVFYDLDLPEVIALRRQLVSESSNNIYLEGSAFDFTWIDTLLERHPQSNFIFIAEGVFMFFEEEKIKSLFLALAERIEQGELHFDACAPWVVKKSHKHDAIKNSKATFRWGVEKDGEMETWSPRLKHRGTTWYVDQAKWRWGIEGVIGRIFPKYKNAFRMLHYTIG